MPSRKDFMVTQLNENVDQAYTNDNPTPGVAGGAASNEASGRQRHADDCATIAGVTFAEPPLEKSNSNAYCCEENFHFWLSHRFLPFWTYLDAICRIATLTVE